MEDLHEGFTELDVEGRVDDGVHSTVDVAQPREGAVQDRRDVAVTVNVQDVCDEEGQPADDEHAWGRGERSGWLRGRGEAELGWLTLSGHAGCVLQTLAQALGHVLSHRHPSHLLCLTQDHLLGWDPWCEVIMCKECPTDTQGVPGDGEAPEKGRTTEQRGTLCLEQRT